MTIAPFTPQSSKSRSDWYDYEGLEPTLYRALEDDVSLIIGQARLLGYIYYLYPGLVVQLQPESYVVGINRYFVSFNITNDARQTFHEASGAGMVFRSHEREEFLETLRRDTFEYRRMINNGTSQSR